MCDLKKDSRLPRRQLAAVKTKEGNGGNRGGRDGGREGVTGEVRGGIVGAKWGGAEGEGGRRRERGGTERGGRMD